MFFILSKVFSVFVNPITWIVVCFIVGYIGWRRAKKVRIICIGIILLLIFSNAAIFGIFIKQWEDEGVNFDKVEYHDIGVVLGGMFEFNEKLDRLSIRRGGDRLWQAINLYHNGLIGKILISGSNGFVSINKLDEANQIKTILIKQGIPSDDIIVESNSKNTYQNAIFSKEIIDRIDVKQSVLLITSAIHMKRSKACFEKAGFSNIKIFSTDHYVGQSNGFSLAYYFIPNSSVLVSWEQLIHEWIGYVSYYLAGYI